MRTAQSEQARYFSMVGRFTASSLVNSQNTGAAIARPVSRSMPLRISVPAGLPSDSRSPRTASAKHSAQASTFDARAFLDQRRGNYAAILTGTLATPQLVGTEGQVRRWQGPVGLLAGHATSAEPTAFPEVASAVVTTSAAAERSSRIQTAQVAQMLLFLLTMLLAGMVLSNLVEEKANKIIEILAAAIPMDAVFMGKLFAMLGVSFVGIGVWGLAAFGLWSVGSDAIIAATGFDIARLPAPAVGWPLFIGLGILYFAMAYLLIGSLFLAIGSSLVVYPAAGFPIEWIEIGGLKGLSLVRRGL